MSSQGAFKYYPMSGLGDKGISTRSNRSAKCQKDQSSASHKNHKTYLMRLLNLKNTKKKCIKSKPKCVETQHKFTMRGQSKCVNGVRLCRGEAHKCSKKPFISYGLVRAQSGGDKGDKIPGARGSKGVQT